MRRARWLAGRCRLGAHRRLVVLGKQSDVVAQVYQAVEQRLRFGSPSDGLVGIRQLEAAGEEYLFAGIKPIRLALRVAAQHEGVDHEAAPGQLGYSTASGPPAATFFLEATALQQAATIAVAMGLLLLSIPNGRICSRYATWNRHIV